MEKELIEKSIFVEIPTKKIYGSLAIGIATFLGGPLVAGYLIAENFRTFKDNKKAKITWIITIVTIILSYGVFFFIKNINLPNEIINISYIIIPVTYIAVTFYFAKIFQEQKSNEHIKNGGKYYSWWRIMLIAMIANFILALLISGFFLFYIALMFL
ncbi:hypothetical protein CLU81_0533 [Flavobacterium sp. 9]|uniref:hypothetical protein n=1 Tax=Flavobacterium sp. 9 TaxID=2035198 RepID=UPI000C17CE4C|nr:hypothetical protein [Flavobacterium sp. 9]PIF30130.1 hypothetical protein CLU81_0533 [Flavobacterium sp. 9]